MYFRFLTALLVCSFAFNSSAQKAKWESGVIGKLYSLKEKTPYPGFKSGKVFELFENIPAIGSPKGFDVGESFVTSDKIPHAVTLTLAFNYYYSYAGGTIQRIKQHAPGIHVAINKFEDLLDLHNFIFADETGALGFPRFYTDTFRVTYQTINGCTVGTFLNTAFGGRIKSYILNPGKLSIFRLITREEFFKVLIKHLSSEIEDFSKGIAETEKFIHDFGDDEKFKNSIGDFKQQNKTMAKWIAFLKEKRGHFKNVLQTLSEQERKSPAVYAMYKNVANIRDKHHKLLDTISGHLPYEPLEDRDEVIVSGHLYTFSEKIFDPKLPKSKFQLMIISEAFNRLPLRGIESEMSDFFDDNINPHFPFCELIELMK